MTDTGIFIFGCGVYAIVIAASLVGMIGMSDENDHDEESFQSEEKKVYTNRINGS